MKFLNVYCQKRATTVYINIEKIILISTPEGQEENTAIIDLQGLEDKQGAVVVSMSPAELVRLINGEEKSRIGFRSGGG